MGQRPHLDQPLRLAILDDYAAIAPKHFQHIPGLTIDTFPDTLNPSKPDDLELLVARLAPYAVISSMRERTPFPSALLSRLPKLQLLMNSSRRNKAIDLDCATARGIVVTGTTGVESDNESQRLSLGDEPSPPQGYPYVIQHAWALLLGLCSRVAEADRVVKTPGSGNWQQAGFATSLGGKVLGVVGLGRLGVAMAKIAVQSFGMRVVAWSENLTVEKANDAAMEAGLEKGLFEMVTKEELFRRSDVISLHYVLSDRSRGMVGERELGWMKRSGLLLNTSRAGLIDEHALINTLTRGSIKGVAMDVLWEEPLSADSAWRTCDEWAQASVLLSPHMGYAFEGLINRFYQEQAEILELWIRGEDVQPRMT